MRRVIENKWFIAAITALIIVGAYYEAKNNYYSQIEKRIDVINPDLCHKAITISYPFLWQSADAIITRADMIKSIASEAGFDRYVFSVLWKQYKNTPEYDYRILYHLESFENSNAYRDILHAPKRDEKEALSVIRMVRVNKHILNIENIVEMDSILHMANRAKQYAYQCLDATSNYKNNSHDIYDWKKIGLSEWDYNKQIIKYETLKRKPFSLCDYLFNNPLDKE